MKYKNPRRTKCCANCRYFICYMDLSCTKDYMAEIDYDFVCRKHRYVIEKKGEQK